MNEDWRAGDLAVCVFDEWYRPCLEAPKVNDLLRVSGVTEGVGDQNYGSYFLSFSGKPYQWECIAFRKVGPDARAAETEFTAYIKRLGKSPARVE